MQLVGRQCERCSKKVKAAIEAEGCLSCGKEFHIDCLEENEDRCPDCQERFEEQRARVSKASRERAAMIDRKGSPRFGAAVFAIFFAIAGGCGVSAYFSTPGIFGHIAIAAGLLGLILAVRTGGMVLGFGVGVAVKVEHSARESRRPEHTRLGVAIAGVVGVLWAGVLVWSQLDQLWSAAAAEGAVGVLYAIAAYIMIFDKHVRALVARHDSNNPELNA